MTIASELQALATDVQNARTAITNKGGTVTASGGTSQLATDIATIPAGASDIGTSAEMDALLVEANAGRLYRYVGTTTSSYRNGAYYKVCDKATATVEPQYGSYYAWGPSANKPSDHDPSTMSSVWRSENYHVQTTYAVCKILLHDVTTFTLYINSYAESSCDFTIASKVDVSTFPTYSTAGKAHTSSYQKSPAGTIASSWKTVTYTTADGLGIGDHYIYIVYRKDGSVDRNLDRGHFFYSIPQTTYGFTEYLNPVGNEVITDTAVHDVSDKATAQVVDSSLNASNIKKDVTILGVTGTYDPGGGGGGYRVYFRCTGADDYGYCRINDSEDYDFKCTSQSSYPYCNNMVLPATGVEKIRFYGFSHSGTYPGGGYSWVRWRPHASDWLTWTGDTGTDFSIGGSGVELVLTGDIDIMASYATCLTGDTLILMADGTEKRLDEIYIGDKVLGASGPVEVVYCDSDCTKWHNHYDVWTFDDGTVVRTVHPHRFWNVDRAEFVYMDQWELGERALNKDGEKVALVDHQTIDDDIRHYTLFTSDSNTYYANGLLSGNRHSVYDPNQPDEDEETLRIV